MKKHHFLFLTLALLANHAYGADEPNPKISWLNFVSLTPTNVVFKWPLNHTERPLNRTDLLMWETYVQLPTTKPAQLHKINPGDDVLIPLDKEIGISDVFRINKVIYTPIMLKNQQKGFRITYLSQSNRYLHSTLGYIASFRHVALNETPVQVDDSEVLMILENGKWKSIEEAESLEITKLKWKAGAVLRRPKMYMDDSGNNATHSHYGPLFAELITHGLVTPTVELRAALIKAGHLPNEELEPLLENENTQTNDVNVWVADEKTSHENTTPCRPASREWLWWFALLPAAAGAWFAVRLRRRRK